METFSALLALCEGNPPVAGGTFEQQRARRVQVFGYVFQRKYICPKPTELYYSHNRHPIARP